MAHGCPLQAIVVAFGVAERRRRLIAAGRHPGQAVQEHVVERPRALGQVQADRSRQETRGRRVDGSGDDGQHPPVARWRSQ